jgi:hypothetical protein
MRGRIVAHRTSLGCTRSWRLGRTRCRQECERSTRHGSPRPRPAELSPLPQVPPCTIRGRGLGGVHRGWDASSFAGGTCWHAAQTPIPPPHSAGCTRSAGGSRQALAEIAHEGRMGVMVPRGPLSHAPTEGRGQRLLEGGHRQVGTPAPCGAGHAWCPARYAGLRPPLWTVLLFSHAMASSPAQALRRRPGKPS